jgi:hypothetical protein
LKQELDQELLNKTCEIKTVNYEGKPLNKKSIEEKVKTLVTKRGFTFA